MAYIAKTNWTNNEIVEAADLNRIEQGIENSVEKVAGKGLSTNDYTTAEKNKLAGIAAQATKNDTDANLRNRATHTGTQSADTIVDGTTNKVFTATEKTKLAGIATGATKNSPDATLLSRANHTGTQSADTITDGTTNKVFTATEKTKLANIESGANKYTHPATHPASMITGLPTSLPANGGNADTVGGFTVGVNVPANAKFTDTTYSEISTAEIDAGTSSTRRTITGKRIKYILDKVQAWLDNKVDKVSGKGLSTNDFSNTYKNKLDGIEAGANNYTHPSSHPASMIEESSSRRFVSDAEKTAWSSKQDALGYTPVPNTRKVNNKALSSDITLDAADIGAVPTTRKVNNKALSSDITLSAADIGAAASGHTHTIANVTNLQTTLNGKAPSVLYGSTVPASLLPGQIFVKI